jgi:hypothetical protein
MNNELPDALASFRNPTKFMKSSEPNEEEAEDKEYEEEQAAKKAKETSGTLDLESPLGKVYQWVTESRAEQTPFNDDFLWSTMGESLITRFKRTNGNMVLIIGPQGSGKSAMCYNLEYALSEDPDGTDGKTLIIKWQGNQETYLLVGVKPAEYYIKLVGEILKSHSINDMRCDLDLSSEQSEILTEIRKNPDEVPTKWFDLFSGTMVKRLERYAGKEAVAYAKKYVTGDKLDTYKHVIVDTMDYNKNKLSQLDHHINQLQEFWIELNQSYDDNCAEYNQHLNLAVFIQKEIFDKYKHFFLGKFNPKYFIDPFPAKSLVNFYIHKFDSCFPFTQEALTELAVLSRGLFRRFKSYIAICLDNSYTITLNNHTNTHLLLEREINNSILERGEGEVYSSKGVVKSKKERINSVIVQPSDVQLWINDKILNQDQDLELANIFPHNKTHRNITTQLLRRLAHGNLKQSDIAEDYFDSDKTNTSRFLTILEANEYIKRIYNGKEKLISLANFEES